MKQIVKLTEESNSLFNLGTISEVNNERYFYFPFWLKKTENPLEFEVLSYDKLPTELTNHINELRNQIKYNNIAPIPSISDGQK